LSGKKRAFESISDHVSVNDYGKDFILTIILVSIALLCLFIYLRFHTHCYYKKKNQKSENIDVFLSKFWEEGPESGWLSIRTAKTKFLLHFIKYNRDHKSGFELGIQKYGDMSEYFENIKTLLISQNILVRTEILEGAGIGRNEIECLFGDFGCDTVLAAEIAKQIHYNIGHLYKPHFLNILS